jgi:signal transduction histidine kinase
LQVVYTEGERFDQAAYRRQVTARRGKALEQFLLIAVVSILFVNVQFSWLAQQGPYNGVELWRLQAIAVAVLAGAAVAYALARAGAVEPAAFLFLCWCIVLATYIDQPQQVVGGRSLISFAVPILAAGVLLPPLFTFLFAGLASAAVLILAAAVGINMMLPIAATFAFFVLAAVTWRYAVGLQEAGLRQAQAEAALLALNGQLERRVDARTAELRAAYAELEHSSRLKDQFLATMSHELRTPLTGIISAADVLAEGAYGTLTTRQEDLVGLIQAGGDQLRRLIADILDFSTIEAGRLVLALQPVPVADTCLGALHAIATPAAQKRQTVTLECPENPGCVQADPRRLRQMLANLLQNAVKFTPEGGEIVLRVEGDAEAGLLRLNVLDTGIGIAAEELETIFQPFRQLDGGLNRSYGGAGLGLPLVQRLAALHGGRVTVTSTMGQGSCFTLCLPWQRPEQAEQLCAWR